MNLNGTSMALSLAEMIKEGKKNNTIKEINLGQSGADVYELERHIKAANVITSFRFWHNFLHGNDTERVRGIFDKMVSDYRECWSK